MCIPCVEETGNCAKCGQKEELVNQPAPSKAESDRIAAELQKEVKALPERKRRTFLRYLRQQEGSMLGKYNYLCTYSVATKRSVIFYLNINILIYFTY